MLTGKDLLKKVRSIDPNKEPTEQKTSVSIHELMSRASEEEQSYFYEQKLRKQRLLGPPIQGPLTLKQFNRNNS